MGLFVPMTLPSESCARVVLRCPTNRASVGDAAAGSRRRRRRDIPEYCAVVQLLCSNTRRDEDSVARGRKRIDQPNLMADHVSSSGSANPPLLVPYRAVGLVSDGVPFAVSQLGTETFVTTAVGRAFQVYQEQKLRLAFAGPQLPRAITALCTEGELTVAAGGSAAHVYRRAELVCTQEEYTAATC